MECGLWSCRVLVGGEWGELKVRTGCQRLWSSLRSCGCSRLTLREALTTSEAPVLWLVRNHQPRRSWQGLRCEFELLDEASL